VKKILTVLNVAGCCDRDALRRLKSCAYFAPIAGDAFATGLRKLLKHACAIAGRRPLRAAAVSVKHRSASAGVGRSQKAILRARTGRHLTFPVKDGDLRTYSPLSADNQQPRDPGG